jgi:hypothetical protein
MQMFAMYSLVFFPIALRNPSRLNVRELAERALMKKPVKRVSLLEDVLSDFFDVENILMKSELKNELQPLTSKQKQLYSEVVARLRELVRDLTKDVEQEHRAA